MPLVTCLIYLIPTAILVAALCLWVVALADVVKRREWEFPQAREGIQNPNERLMWTLIVFFGSGAGALLYYVVVMRPYPRQRG